MTRAALVLGCLALANQPAAADPAAADRAAAEADALARTGNFTAAAAKFREAWQADKLRPELFCNIGIALYKAKDLARAHLVLGECLEQSTLDPKVIDAVRTVVTSIEGVLRSAGHTPVRIVVDPAASELAVTELGPDETFVGSRVVWLPFGTYHVSAHSEGYVDATETVTAATAAPVTVTITLHKPVAATDHPAQLQATASPSPSSRPSAVPAYLATGATAIALTVAIVAYVEGHTRADLAASALDPATLADDRGAVSSWNTTLAIGGSLAIAGAAASTYLWYRAIHHAPVIEVHAGTGGAGAVWVGRF